MRNATKTVFACILSGALAAPVHAEVVPGTSFDIQFESANIVGSGRNLNAFRVPVKDLATGAVSYYDVSFAFRLGANGLTFEGIRQASVSPVGSVHQFIAGTYVDASGNQFIVAGPGTSAGREAWSVTKQVTQTSSTTFDAAWTTGPLANHPQVANYAYVDKLTDVTNGGPAYGRATGYAYSGFPTGVVIAARQTGNLLSIYEVISGSEGSGFTLQRVQ